MLNQVLQTIESLHGPITTTELSQEMGIERGALEGMIQFWVQKGRLRNDDNSVTSSCGCAPQNTGDCTTESDCVFITKMPKTFSLPKID